MCGPLCEAVVKPGAQPGYGLVMLNRLEHANLFIIALDEKHEWFRYHNLFADFLLHIESEINPSEIPELQKRAALWFEQNANLDEAFRYALASGDMEWTATLIERNIETMLKTGEIFSLTHWLGRLPDEVIHRHPFLGLAYAWGSIAAYQVDNALYWIDDVQQVLDQVEKQERAGGVRAGGSRANVALRDSSDGLWNIRGGLAVCRSTLALLNGDAEQAARFSKQAVSSLDEESPFIHSLLALDDSLYHVLSGDTSKAIESLRKTTRIARQANNLMVMVIATCQLAEMQFLQGQLDLSQATYHKAQYMSIGPEGKPLPIAGLADIGLGEILLERNSLAEANAFLEHGIQSTGTLWWLSNLDALISLARLRQAQGDLAGSQAIITQAESLALNTDSSQWDDTLISAAAARLALQRGDLAEAEQWWGRGATPDFTASIPLADYPYQVYEYLVITQARLLLAIGRRQGRQDYLHQAYGLLDALLLEAKRFRRVTSQIEIQMLQSIVLFALGETEPSIKAMQIALAMGEPEGYRRIYLDEGWAIAEIITRCGSSHKTADDRLPSTAFINSLLDALRGAPVPAPTLPAAGEATHEAFTVKTEDGLTISLSLREIEVLSLIAEGKSNQEISARLYLTLNTVKRHAYNIYAKLDVKNRTQAVAKARRLGLIP
jgi:LuxR family maltose regulon positive regulatory protein